MACHHMAYFPGCASCYLAGRRPQRDPAQIAQALAKWEEEWEDLPETKPGRLYFLAQRLISLDRV